MAKIGRPKKPPCPTEISAYSQDVLTPKEVACILRKSSKTVIRMAQDKALDCIMYQETYLFPRRLLAAKLGIRKEEGDVHT